MKSMSSQSLTATVFKSSHDLFDLLVDIRIKLVWFNRVMFHNVKKCLSNPVMCVSEVEKSFDVFNLIWCCVYWRDILDYLVKPLINVNPFSKVCSNQREKRSDFNSRNVNRIPNWDFLLNRKPELRCDSELFRQPYP